MPTEALKILDKNAVRLNLSTNNSLKTEFHLIKSMILLKLCQKVQPEERNLLLNSVILILRNALGSAVMGCNLVKIREIYYLLSRVYNELNDIKNRDQFALFFVSADEELLINSRQYIGFTCHFDINGLINGALNQINEFTNKYSC